jgi:hypothetical protein
MRPAQTTYTFHYHTKQQGSAMAVTASPADTHASV